MFTKNISTAVFTAIAGALIFYFFSGAGGTDFIISDQFNSGGWRN